MYNKISKFIFDQFKQIRKGGLTLLFKKLCIISLIPIILLGILFIRLLRPFKIIKFGRLTSSRIGHFLPDVDIYLCESKAGIHGRKSFDIFYYGSDQFCNYQLKKMCERSVRVRSFAKYLDKVNRFFPCSRNHIVPFALTRDIHGVTDRFPPHFFLSSDEESLGEKELKRIGIPRDLPFVCFSARDSAYLDTAFPENSSWAYHNYRNGDIYNYLPAVEELVKRGNYAIRMGKAVKEALKNDNPKIIDYANKYRTDFLDVYLGAKCKFFICDTAGIYALAAIFRRPIAWVNFIPLEHVHTWSKDYLIIPKKLWLQDKHRFLTFKEILDSEISRFLFTQQYEQLGIEVIENTPEEITALIIEMDQRLKGQWQASEEDEELQKRFWALFKPSELNKALVSRIGAEFLRQNKELLE